MGKLVFAALVPLAGLAVHGALKRRGDRLPGGIGALATHLVLLLAIGIPAATLVFSVVRIIPAGQVGVIQQQYLARWDGRLPQYSLGGNTVPLLSIPGPGAGGAGEVPRR